MKMRWEKEKNLLFKRKALSSLDVYHCFLFFNVDSRQLNATRHWTFNSVFFFTIYLHMYYVGRRYTSKRHLNPKQVSDFLLTFMMCNHATLHIAPEIMQYTSQSNNNIFNTFFPYLLSSAWIKSHLFISKRSMFLWMKEDEKKKTENRSNRIKCNMKL